jgi:transcriptional regulator with XRE-family HTH domain
MPAGIGELTPTELKAARRALGLSAEGFARLVRVQSGRTVRRWEKGDAPIPGAVEVIVSIAVPLQHSGDIARHTYSFEVTVEFDNGVAVNDFVTALNAIRS